MQIDEPIKLSNYDSQWIHYFEREKQTIKSVITHHIVAIEHFGSTAVPGMMAKPIIDILVGVRLYPLPKAAIKSLQNLAYEYCGEAGVIGRQYFRKRGSVSFNISAVEHGGSHWHNNLLLRDYLQTHETAAQTYKETKQKILKEGLQMLLSYSERKQHLINNLLKEARKWKKE